VPPLKDQNLICLDTEAHIILWRLFVLASLLIALGAVAFVTLLERKILSLRQIRLGPNKVTVSGLLQPIADGVKLLFKQLPLIVISQLFLFVVIPLLMLVRFLLVWFWAIPWPGGRIMKYSSIVYFVLIGLGTYVVILVGWSSTRVFSKLGSIRGILQGLSFEVALVLTFIIILILITSFKVKREVILGEEMLLLWVTVWLVLSLIESNRAPFDLLEGERELIRGFNLEIGSLTFVFLFLREYGIIIVIGTITALVAFDLLAISPCFIAILIFVRRCYPRIRYDSLIRLMWKVILPAGVIGLYCIFNFT